MQELDQQLSLVDYTQISLSGRTLTVPDGMQLDLGAVGKGYAADLAAKILQENGVESAILSLGGNIHTIGTRPDGTDWRVGIRTPWEEEYLGVLEISDAAVVTSGGYENHFEDESGNIYWHILDPAKENHPGQAQRSSGQAVHKGHHIPSENCTKNYTRH